MSLIDLSGKVALVTGGSRGIGAATAVLLAQAGAGVAITYRSRKEDAEAVMRLVSGSRERGAGPVDVSLGSVSPIAIQADLAHADDNERVVQQTVEHFGSLDIFVANAGIWPPEEVPVADMTDEQWRRTIAANLDSVFFGCRAAMNAMLLRMGHGGSPETPGPAPRSPLSDAAAAQGRKGGRLVIVSSTAGQRGEGFHADYAATKGAVQALVKSLCIEAAPYDITVNAVAPGWVDTEMCEIPFGREAGSGKRAIEQGIPLGRVASPEDIAGPIVFLCSDLARHVTGEILNVNGGSVLCG